MAKNNNLTDFLKGIADKLRSKLSTTALINPQDFETKIDDVYTQGEKEKLEAFWDSVFMPNGAAQINYDYAFSGYIWTHLWGTIPKEYVITPKSKSGVGFRGAFLYSSIINPFKTSVYPNGKVTLDTSHVTHFTNSFSSSWARSIPIIDATSDTSGLYRCFSGAINVKSIDKIILRDDGTNTFVNTFQYCNSLEDITIQGVIGQKGFNVSSCTKLTHDSLLSIINALKDYSGTTTAQTVTLGATNLAKLTDAEKATATEKGWTLA